MTRARLLAGILPLVLCQFAGAMTPDERRDYREKLLGILPKVPAFEEWVRKTDELPPDFDALPRHNALPDPLRFLDGRPVQSATDWQARRTEIRSLFEKYAWGSIPPHPKLERVEVTAETAAPGFRTRNAVLHFGPGGAATLRVTLVIPDGRGPFPVLMGPSLAGGMMGNASATMTRRGYITASYAGNDGNDDSAAALAQFPPHDAATLPRRAWAATMVLDYLEQVPEADMKKVAIYGYSRDGKQATIAAALDERIGALIAGSTGVGGVLPYRLAGERNQAESIQSTTLMFPDWFHPRLRYFSGREDRLPVDGNLLLAMVAPRPVLMVSGQNDEVANNWGDEQSLHSANKVYALLGAPDRLGILRLPGFHGANDMEAALDFLDVHFGRSARTWHNQYQFPWDYQAWQTRHGQAVGAPPARANTNAVTVEGARSKQDFGRGATEIRKAVEWTLGEGPPLIATAARGRGGAMARGGGRGPGTMPGRAGAGLGRGAGGGGANPGQVVPDVPGWVIQRSLGGLPEFGWAYPEAQTTQSRPVSFGQGVRGTLYYPGNVVEGAKLPVAVWLHSYSYPLGYMWVYHREPHPILALVKQGYAVLAYDQAGFGSRINEAGPFMDRFPRWSLMGRMVEDARAAVDTLSRDPQLDAEQIWLFGYSMGGNVALHTAALEPKVKGVVCVAGFTPMRTDTAEKGTGGLARYSVERPLVPRLGQFIGKESQVPYDYDELLALVAPRPVLVVSPKYDRDATPADVRAAVERARKVYALDNAGERLALDEPWDYNRLSAETQDRAIAWMKQQAQK